ncbi:MAG: 3-hydroxyacyl-CoA dehydrogenase family protein [Chloroflexota bacterium]
MKPENVAVIGAGTMGHGIAQVFALAGFQVSLTDNDANVLENAMLRIRANLETFFEHGVVSEDEAVAALTRIKLVSNSIDAASQAGFIVEAVFEDLTLKRQVLRQLEEHCPTYAVIASNTSSFCVGDMACVLDRPEQFLITHFWNPPHIIPLVEIVPGEHASTETIETTFRLFRDAGKCPVLVKKDVAGFVGNRLQHALRREAIAIVAQDIASPQDVDLVARLGFGLRLPVVGPLETVDLGGLDLTLAIQSYLLPRLDRSTEPSSLIQEKVARGELGAKTGQGFFNWPSEQAARTIRQRDETLLKMIKLLKDQCCLPS